VFSLIQYDIASVCPDDSLAELHPRLHRIDLSKTTSAVAASLGLPSSNSSLLSGSASIAAPKSSAENSPLSAFFVALKTRLASVLDSRLVYLEDKLRALDATRNSNSFDFNRFFLLKEGVALAYQQLQMKVFPQSVISIDPKSKILHFIITGGSNATLLRVRSRG
jgi:hypothetical protein